MTESFNIWKNHQRFWSMLFCHVKPFFNFLRSIETSAETKLLHLNNSINRSFLACKTSKIFLSNAYCLCLNLCGYFFLQIIFEILHAKKLRFIELLRCNNFVSVEPSIERRKLKKGFTWQNNMLQKRWWIFHTLKDSFN